MDRGEGRGGLREGGTKADDGAGRDSAEKQCSGPSQADQQTGSGRQATFYNPLNPLRFHQTNPGHFNPKRQRPGNGGPQQVQ